MTSEPCVCPAPPEGGTIWCERHQLHKNAPFQQRCKESVIHRDSMDHMTPKSRKAIERLIAWMLLATSTLGEETSQGQAEINLQLGKPIG